MAIFPNIINFKYVSYCFGYSKARLSTLCRHKNINIWSPYKPISHPDKSRPDSVRRLTGFKQVDATFNTRAIKQWVYDPPTGGVNSPFVLADFRGYNPFASAPKLILPESTFISDNATRAEFKATLILPQIPLERFSPNLNTVSIEFESFLNTTVVGSVVVPPNTYGSIDIPCVQYNGLPSNGNTSHYPYYVRFGLGEYLVNPQLLMGYMAITKPIIPNLNDDTQYVNAGVNTDGINVGFDGIIGTDKDIAYTSFKYWYADGKQTMTRVKISGLLVHTPINLVYRSGDLSWKFIRRFENGAYPGWYYDIPEGRISQYMWMF